MKYDIYVSSDYIFDDARKLIKTVYVDDLNVTQPVDERFRAANYTQIVDLIPYETTLSTQGQGNYIEIVPTFKAHATDTVGYHLNHTAMLVRIEDVVLDIGRIEIKDYDLDKDEFSGNIQYTIMQPNFQSKAKHLTMYFAN